MLIGFYLQMYQDGLQLYFTDDILKGLSHEIDFKNFDKNLQNLV
jgi:hypothetical protein